MTNVRYRNCKVLLKWVSQKILTTRARQTKFSRQVKTQNEKIWGCHIIRSSNYVVTFSN